MRIIYINENSNKPKVKIVEEVDFYNGYIVTTNWNFEEEKISIEDIIRIEDGMEV